MNPFKRSLRIFYQVVCLVAVQLVLVPMTELRATGENPCPPEGDGAASGYACPEWNYDTCEWEATGYWDACNVAVCDGSDEPDPGTKECCDGVVVDADMCCGGVELSAVEVCCEDTPVLEVNCCNGQLVDEDKVCCGGTIVPIDQCCNDQVKPDQPADLCSPAIWHQDTCEWEEFPPQEVDACNKPACTQSASGEVCCDGNVVFKGSPPSNIACPVWSETSCAWESGAVQDACGNTHCDPSKEGKYPYDICGVGSCTPQSASTPDCCGNVAYSAADAETTCCETGATPAVVANDMCCDDGPAYSGEVCCRRVGSDNTTGVDAEQCCNDYVLPDGEKCCGGVAIDEELECCEEAKAGYGETQKCCPIQKRVVGINEDCSTGGGCSLTAETCASQGKVLQDCECVEPNPACNGAAPEYKGVAHINAGGSNSSLALKAYEYSEGHLQFEDALTEVDVEVENMPYWSGTELISYRNSGIYVPREDDPEETSPDLIGVAPYTTFGVVPSLYRRNSDGPEVHAGRLSIVLDEGGGNVDDIIVFLYKYVDGEWAYVRYALNTPIDFDVDFSLVDYYYNYYDPCYVIGGSLSNFTDSDGMQYVDSNYFHFVVISKTSAPVKLKAVVTPEGGDSLIEATIKFITPILVDANNDGEITIDDKDATSYQNPYRFWSNDDDDDGDTTNNDVPGQAAVLPDWNTFNNIGHVDGRTDLIDFFPVFLDIKQLLNVLPHDTAGITYKLKQADEALNFVYTNLTRLEAFDFLKHNKERQAYGRPDDEGYAHEATTRRITATGAPLDSAFLARIKNESDKGVILIEGCQPTDKPLRLVVEKEGVGEIAEVALHLKISPVEDFYRWINLRGVSGQNETRPTNVSQPPAYPDALTNVKMFIWVHGYNVNEYQSRGWSAEAFKRMWHSRSKAMFTAVSWHGDHSQISLPVAGFVAPDYWDNIPNAFLTAEALAPLVNQLPGSSKVIAGHSMGNVVVSSAIVDHSMNITKYFMVDAAVALEAYDTSVATTGPYFINAMRPIAWEHYDRRLWSTDWWKLFPDGDNRRLLSWRNFFGNIPNAINVYSSGEDVLNNNDITPGELPYSVLPVGAERAWIQQEMSKGGGSVAGTLAGVLNGEIQGGWGFNSAWDDEASIITDDQLRAQPFFTRFDKVSLMHADVGAGSSGSDSADAATIVDLLGGAIPALSFPAGRNPVPLFNSTSRNQNLMELQDGWPTERPNTRWLHSDIRNVAYFFNYSAWDFFTTEGNLQ